MSLFTAHATRWARGWELHIDGVGVTQSRTLRDAKAMIRDYIALDLGKDISEDDIELTVELGDSLDQAVHKVHVLNERAAATQAEAAELARSVVQRLLGKAHLSGADAAVVLGISPQRISQLASGGGSKRTKKSTKKALPTAAKTKRGVVTAPGGRTRRHTPTTKAASPASTRAAKN